MTTTESIDRAIDLVGWLETELHDLAFPGSLRNTLSVPCFAIAQEHFHSIAVLFKSNLNSSAFALVRPQYETYIRGMWLGFCATDKQLDDFAKGVELPRINVLISDIEGMIPFDDRKFSKIKANSWGLMCAYTHTGSRQVFNWITPETIESDYSSEEIAEVIKFTASFALLSAIGMADLANNKPLTLKLVEKMRDHAK